ncbi:MAG: DUF1214 domain-containing protein, partial [Acidimicrobiia bacterium]
VYFAPEALKGMEANWLQTIPGKSWFIILRMYGPTEAWIDKTWRPGEREPVTSFREPHGSRKGRRRREYRRRRSLWCTPELSTRNG